MGTGRPAGRPAKPTESKTAEVSKGKLSTSMHSDDSLEAPTFPPTVPKRAFLVSLWERMWRASGTHLNTEQDYFYAVMILENYGEIYRMKDYLKKNGDRLEINGGTNLIIDPYVKQINELQTKNTSLFAAFGFSPADRARLGLNESAGANPFDVFLVRMDGIRKSQRGK